MKTILAALMLFALSVDAQSLKHHFPSAEMMLGKPVFWRIEIEHDPWQSFSFKPVKNAQYEITLASDRIDPEGKKLVHIFRLKVVPLLTGNLPAPSITLSDSKGQSITVTGSAAQVFPISGESLEIKSAPAPKIRHAEEKNTAMRVVMIASVLLLLGAFLSSRLYRTSRRQVLLRSLRSAAQQPLYRRRESAKFVRLLRSELIWGNAANVMTTSEMKSANAPKAFTEIANLIEELEKGRYSPAGGSDTLEEKALRKGLHLAIELVSGRKSVDAV